MERFYFDVLLLTALPTLKVLTMVMLWSLDLLAKLFGLNLVIEVSNTERKIISNDTLTIEIIFQNESSAKLQTAKSGFLVRIRCLDANIKSKFETHLPKTEEDTIENRLKPEVPQIFTTNPFEAISKFRVSKVVEENGYLSIGVYACVAATYMQLVILVIALNASSTPPGLIFLSLSIFFIGYVVFKVS